MDVHMIAVHSLLKVEGETKASSDLSTELLGVDDKSIKLIIQLNSNYNKASITYAVFEKPDSNEFPRLFTDYLIGQGENCFLDFTQKSTEILRKRIENIPAAKGGFLVFAEYSNANTCFLAVYLIRDTNGILFRKDKSTSSYKINPTIYVDQDKLAMACRINVSNFNTNHGKYLSVLKKRMNDISEYFINWIAATQKESNQTYTRDFYNLINLAKLPINDNNEEIPRDSFKKNVYDYINSIPSKTVNVNDISEQFYGDVNYLADLAESNKIYIDTEFRPVAKEMKKFLRIDLESDGILIRFARKELQNSKVRFDKDNKNVVIIESEKFASDLRREIESNVAS